MNFSKRNVDVFDNSVQKNKTEYSSNVLKRVDLPKEAFKLNFVLDEKYPDSYELNNPIQFIYKYLNSDVIDNAIDTNPQIPKIVLDNSLSLKYDIENVSSIIVSHLIPCARMVHRMYLNIQKNPVMDDYIHLMQATLLHDIGKVFIPKQILNKSGKLSSRERQIVELHSRLSYEILKTTNLSPRVARFAWEHHNYDECFNRTIYNQVLMVADIYCALREVRPYKKALNDIAAKTVLYDMGSKGCFDISFIKYLL